MENGERWLARQERRRLRELKYRQDPVVKERRRLRQEARRRAAGVRPLAEYLVWLAERNRERRGTRPQGKIADTVPYEIRDLWRRSSPGSSLRRMFPTPMELNKASYDTLTQTATNREE